MMPSKVRAPKPFHSEHWAIDFTVKNRQIFYHILKWNEQGTTQSLIKSERYHNEKPQSLLTLLINGDANLGALA